MRSLITRAARIEGPKNEIALAGMSLHRPGKGEVLVKMEACGICHSDLFVAGLPKLPVSPLTLGHEAIGRVEALGQDVSRVALGDRVGITFLASTCGTCEFCRTGRARYCARQVNHGYTRDGALAEFAVLPVDHLAVVPDALASKLAAPLCCAGWTAYAAVREAGLESGHSLAVFGMGGLGHLALQYAQHRGLRVAAADIAQRKLAHARMLGADIVLPLENPGRTMLKQHGGADAAIVFTPAPAAVREAFTSLKRNGALILVGLAQQNYELPVLDTVLKGITIRGSYLGTPDDLEAVFALALNGVGVPQVETHPFCETLLAIERLRKGQVLGRAVIVF